MSDANVHGLFEQATAEMLVSGIQVGSGRVTDDGDQVVIFTFWGEGPRRTIAIPVDLAEALAGKITEHVDLLRNPKPRLLRARPKRPRTDG
jgi:hypothetical protein